MSWPRRIIGLVAVLFIALAVWRLEQSRAGLEIAKDWIGETPVSLYRAPDAAGPVVVIAHGFAGSRQMMEAYSLTLAHAGYLVLAFDFAGHGQNRLPMMGDVGSVDGVTRQLVSQTRAVIDVGLAQPGADGRVALLGHSMASDVIVRTALADPRVGPVVGVSMYSEAVTATHPRNMLMIAGEWEPGLRAAALDALHLVDPAAGEGDTASNSETEVSRRAVVAPKVEHVAVLYSTTALSEARAWLDQAFGRSSQGEPAETGPWLLLLLGSIVALAWPLAGLFPQRAFAPTQMSPRRFFILIGLPMVAAPLLASLVEGPLLPVLVADYLALHLLLYGGLQLLLLWRFGAKTGPIALFAAFMLALYGIGLFGGALDRYAANFTPHDGRYAVLLAIAVGAVPFMLADSLVTQGGRAPIWRRLSARFAILLSFVIALLLDFEGLFFLIIVLPVIVLFFIIFGLMGRWLARRSGPVAAGLGLGLILAWSLAVTFPLLDPDGDPTEAGLAREQAHLSD